ncbi:MAG TPA: hypothetical protein VG269_15420 [Tepidisphaeraceae bacterium]|nr:hypothetical protein [Tepidisphaeraceae bacterium]
MRKTDWSILKRVTVLATCGALCVTALLSTRRAFTAPAAATAAPPAAPDPVLPPLATAPQPSRASAVPVPYRPWLDPARSNGEPRVLPMDGVHPLRPRPALDVPPVAPSSAGLPASVLLPAAPPVRIATPSSGDAPVGVVAKPDTGRPTLVTDDTLDLAPPGALELTPPPRSVSAPFLLLAIPDPTRQAGAVPAPRTTKEDAPVPSFDRPTKPGLPAGK